MSTIRMRIQLEDETAFIRALISHPMTIGETGSYWTTGHYIATVTLEHNGIKVLDSHWGTGVSRNPYLELKVKGVSSGDSIRLAWIDNKGESDSVEVTV